MEYYIHSTPLFDLGTGPSEVDVPDFCAAAEEVIPHTMLQNVEVVYVGEFRELQGKNAMFVNGAIYMTNIEPTIPDLLENFVHEVAHSLEPDFAWEIYDEALVQEFKSKREALKGILESHGYQINPTLYGFTEYNEKFDEFLSGEVGYPTLLSLTMGLFVSPYGATSIQEYFANGFEKYVLGNPLLVKDISPVLYRKIENIIHDKE
jgi:hypothetical protein